MFSMPKFNLVLALLFVNISAYAADYYVNSNSSFPEPQVVTKVYMGDKMLEQKYVYSEQCYTPKKSFTLEEEFEKNKTTCLTSTTTIEDKCCLGGVRKITEGGTMCSSDETNFYPQDFYSFQHKNGTQSDDNWFRFKHKKGKVTVYQSQVNPNNTVKLIKMTDADFEKSFTRTENYWNVSLNFVKDIPLCMAKERSASRIFYGVDAQIEKTLPHKTMTERVSSVSVNPSEDGFNITANHNQGTSTWNLSKEEFNNSFEETSKVIEVEAGMQRTIEYAGINGNLVKFIYSEFKDGVARDAFTREFTIDLSGDSVAAYKGAVFEVLKATNSTIEYKVIRNFPVET